MHQLALHRYTSMGQFPSLSFYIPYNATISIVRSALNIGNKTVALWVVI